MDLFYKKTVRRYIEEYETSRQKILDVGDIDDIRDIHQALIAEGYDISYPTVVNTVNDLLNKGAEAYIKAEYNPEDVCEFDLGKGFGESKIIHKLSIYYGFKFRFCNIRYGNEKGRACGVECGVHPQESIRI